MSGTQAVTATPVQLPKQTPAVGRPGRRRGQQVGGKPPLWVRIVMALICFAWIVPTLGLVITSFRSQEAANSTGWGGVFPPPSGADLTLGNYSEVFTKADMGTAFVNSLAITLPATIIPILIAAFAAYAFTFMVFPGRDLLLILIVGLLVVPTQVALVPLLRIYGDLGISGTFLAIWLAHIGFGMPLAGYITPKDNGAPPKGGNRVGKDRRGQPLPDLLAADPADVHTRPGVVRHLPVPLGLERSAQRPGLHRAGAQPAAPHRAEPVAGKPGAGLAAAHRGWSVHDDRADRRVPVAAAVLRPRPHRRVGQGLRAARGSGTASGIVGSMTEGYRE